MSQTQALTVWVLDPTAATHMACNGYIHVWHNPILVQGPDTDKTKVVVCLAQTTVPSGLWAAAP